MANGSKVENRGTFHWLVQRLLPQTKKWRLVAPLLGAILLLSAAVVGA